MKFLSCFFFACVILYVDGLTQVITTEQVFPVEGYSVFEMGYPMKVAQGRSNRFTYMEYWAEGKEGRRISNYYLQSYGTRDYVEHWFKPVTNEGFEGMQVKDLLRLERCYAVIGRQFVEEDRLVHTVCRFFALDGKSKASEPTKLSTYERRQKKTFYDTTLVSPSQKAMLWMGTDGRIVYAATWNESGNKIWNKELELPFMDNRYKIREVSVDDEANPWFLLEPEIPGAGKPLILTKYIHEKEEFYTEQIVVPGAESLIHTHLALMKGGQIAVAGVMASNAGVGFKNGGKFRNPSTANFLNGIFLRYYEKKKTAGPELEIISDKISPIPGRWMKRYAEEGANFSLSRLMIAEKRAVLLLEEHYSTRKKLYFYDVACMGFDLATGEIIWNQIIQKRQRDTHSDAFMSYVSGIARGKLRLIYLTERGAAGQLLCTSIDLASGSRKDKMLASNEEAKYLFFPRRSGMVSNYDMVLIGRGNPSQNDYKLISIAF